MYIVKTLLAGGIAGSAAKTVVAPFDRVKILFQTSHKSYESYQGEFKILTTGSIRGYFKALSDIQRNQGTKALFQGHSATLLRIFPYAGIKFMAYEQFKLYMMPTKSDETGKRKFIAGSLAGCTATCFAYPLDLIRVRLAYEVKSCKNPGDTIRIRDICDSIYRECPSRPTYYGIFNFYRGLGPTLVGMIPYAGVSFYTYESLKKYALKTDMFLNKSPPPELYWWATLGCGALSGMMAQTCSYPLEIIRRHMQVSGKSQFKKMHVTMLSTFKDIFNRRGFRGFWVGLGIGYLKITPMFAVSFWTYEYCKQLLKIT